MGTTLGFTLKAVIHHNVKASLYAISSDTNQLQFIKLHHFKQEIF